MKQELITLILEQHALHIFAYTQRFSDRTPDFYTYIPVFQEKAVIFQLPLLMQQLRALDLFSARTRPLAAIALHPTVEIINTIAGTTHLNTAAPLDASQILHSRYSCIVDPAISLWYHCTFSALSLLQVQLLALQVPYRCIALTSIAGALIGHLGAHKPTFAWTMELNNQLPLMPQLEAWCTLHPTTRLHTIADGLRIIANEEV